MKIDKHHILREVKRLAIANDGKAPGRLVFERETGIKESDWYPHIWLRWGEAQTEAGYSPSQLQTRISDEVLIQKYISLVRELGKFPVVGELLRKAKSDRSFPSGKVFGRFGGKEKLIEAVIGHCRDNPAFEDILALSVELKRPLDREAGAERQDGPKVVTGLVYLMRTPLQDWPNQFGWASGKRTCNQNSGAAEDYS